MSDSTGAESVLLPRLRLARAVDGVRVTPEEMMSGEAALSSAADALDALHDSGKVGFLNLAWEDWQIPRCNEVAADLAAHGSTMLLLGIGGSALGARAIVAGLPDSIRGDRSLEILDTIDPAGVTRCLASLDPADTVVVAVSKSGSTVETVALLRLCIEWLSDAVGDNWTQRVAVITDPETGPLRQLAQARGLQSLPVPNDVGGRFSVLTAVGMLPASFLGLDTNAFWTGALAQRDAVHERSLENNSAWQFAWAHHRWREHLSSSVWLTYCDQLLELGFWFRQLLGESLGKVGTQGERLGWTPLVARGPADQHSMLQLWRDGPRNELFTILHVDAAKEGPVIPGLRGAESKPGLWLKGHTLGELSSAARRGTTASLVDSAAPVMELSLDRLDEAALGALFVLLESSVALMGILNGVDPFDQPAVEDAKRYAAGLLGRQDCAADAARALALLEALDER